MLQQIGFDKVKSLLESELNQKYIEAARPTLMKLDEMCQTLKRESLAIAKELEENRIDVQKQKVSPD